MEQKKESENLQVGENDRYWIFSFSNKSFVNKVNLRLIIR